MNIRWGLGGSIATVPARHFSIWGSLVTTGCGMFHVKLLKKQRLPFRYVLVQPTVKQNGGCRRGRGGSRAFEAIRGPVAHAQTAGSAQVRPAHVADDVGGTRQDLGIENKGTWVCGHGVWCVNHGTLLSLSILLFSLWRHKYPT